MYNVDQQRLRYLVEFTLDGDEPGDKLTVEDAEVTVETNLPADIYDTSKLNICEIH